MGNAVLSWLGKRIAGYLIKEIPGYEPSTPPDFASLERSIQPGDVLLIEGNTRIASAIKYLTQSTWSHSAMYVGTIAGRTTAEGEAHVLIEATPVEGVISAPLSKYRFSHVRICRAHALTPQDRAAVVNYVTERIGLIYDTKERFRSHAVPGPIAGTSAFSPPCPDSWIWETDAGHLLNADRSGFSVSALSHPAAGETARRRSEGEVAILTRRDPSDPALLALHTARFRHPPILRYH